MKFTSFHVPLQSVLYTSSYERYISINLSKLGQTRNMWAPPISSLRARRYGQEMPRKQTPRVKVPKGSVGIAGNQTGIYPFDSPGGWQIVGKTETEMFTPNRENPTFLRAGDLVKFVAK